MESSLALHANIRLEWKSMEVANTLAYYNTATITAKKKFYSTGPWSAPIKGVIVA